MVTFRNNNNKRSNFRRNDRNFKSNNNVDRVKFSSNFSNNENFQRKSPGRNNHNAPKLIEKYNNLAREALSAGDKILSENYKESPELGMRLIQNLATASSSLGMIGGQMEDIENEGQSVDANTLEFIHKNKTAKLIQAAISMGFAFSEESNQLATEINQLGYHLGMSFQYIDDLLDIQSDAKTH